MEGICNVSEAVSASIFKVRMFIYDGCRHSSQTVAVRSVLKRHGENLIVVMLTCITGVPFYYLKKFKKNTEEDSGNN
jgi:hypothetical protein